MKTQFINKLLSQPWNISREHARTIIGSILQTLRAERPAEDLDGEPLPKMQIVGDVAIIPIVGTLMINLPDWVKAYGFRLTDANDIAEEFSIAVNNPEVAMIVLDVDSPGGWSIAGNKLFELAEAAGKKKPLFAWVADGNLMCSAAYNAAAPSVAIYAGRHAMAVGNIGSYLAHLDDTEFWAKMGFAWEIFRSGEFKGVGEDALNEKQRAFLQEQVDTAGALFRKQVARYRTALPAEEMQGQWYIGADAAARGFCAGTAKDLSAALAKFRALLN